WASERASMMLLCRSPSPRELHELRLADARMTQCWRPGVRSVKHCFSLDYCVSHAHVRTHTHTRAGAHTRTLTHTLSHSWTHHGSQTSGDGRPAYHSSAHIKLC